uniref:Uncharacterized protein n=1 Tax=Ammonifex degensii TaxID=42838 RepID=A0A7C2IEB6_9THEO
MSVHVWSLGSGTCALYTEDPEAAKAARQAKLRPMAAYYRLKGKGAFAWQFAGPEEKVKEVLRKAKKQVKSEQRECAGCGEFFAPRSKRQKFCSKCRQEVKREATRKRVARWRRERGVDQIGPIAQF